MSYITIAIVAYFIISLTQILDKFLLSDRIPKPSVYVFYVALFSLASMILAPFGFDWRDYSLLIPSLISGSIFIYAILFFYKAVRYNEISRVSPLVGSVIIMASLVISTMIIGDRFTTLDLVGIFFLLIGGFFISFDLPIKSKKIFAGFYNSLISGILFAVSYLMFKEIYDSSGNVFINGFIWTRLGLFFGGLSLLLFSKFRREIISSFGGFKRDRKKTITTSFIFVGNKVLGGSQSILIQYAISLGSVTIINALGSIQFVFVLILAYLASIKYPKMFGEKLLFWDWAQKIGAIVLIGIGASFIYL